MAVKKKSSRRTAEAKSEEQQALELPAATLPEEEITVDIDAIDAPADDAKLFERILWVRRNLPATITKDKNTGQYKVLTHEGINGFLLSLLNKAELIDWVSLKSSERSDAGKTTAGGIPYTNHWAAYTYFVKHCRGGDCKAISLEVEGIGEDTGDKGPGKARTYALKSGRTGLFSIAAGDNEEGRAKDTKPNRGPAISAEQLDELLKLADELWGEDSAKGIKALCAHQGFMLEKIADMPAKLFDIGMEQLRRWHTAQSNQTSVDDAEAK